MKKYLFAVLPLILLFLTTGCKKQNDIHKVEKYNLSGKAQKGPFSPGANVTISELDENLSPTGKSYFTTIMDYEGYFELPNVELVSNYVQLKVEGSQFDEVSGNTPVMDDITLYCIADVTLADHMNINILTHLEKDRLIKYKSEGKSFSEAKNLAQKEVLRIFNLENIVMENSEELDISSGEDYNGVLLAISAIILGSHAGFSLTEKLTNIRNDLNDNGIIDSPEIQTMLISTAKFIQSDKIRGNLWIYYNSHNIASFEIPEFQNYLDTFIVNSDYLSVANYTFPEFSQQGINILYFTQDTTSIDTSNIYSMSVFTDINSQIRLWVQLFDEKGDGHWIMSNNEYWTVFSNTDEYLSCRSDFNQNVTTDLTLKFKSQGIAQVFVSIGNPYLEIWSERYIKWGY